MRGSRVMAGLNVLVQLIGIVASIYLMVADSFSRGVALFVIVAGGHYGFTALSNALMYLHQKTMREDEIRELAFVARYSDDIADIPLAWKAIAWGCGLLYCSIAGYSIWYFLGGS